MRNHFAPVQLPRPRNDEWEWQVRAACRSMPIAMFFPPQGIRGAALAKAEREAKLVCAQCPIIERCLQHALDCGEPYGVWGGLNPSERVRAGDVLAAPEPTRQMPPTHRIGPPKRSFKKVRTG